MTSAVASVLSTSIAGEKAEVIADGLHIGVAVGGVALAEARDVLLGAVECLRLPHADDLLLQLGRHIADRLARRAERLARPPREERSSTAA